MSDKNISQETLSLIRNELDRARSAHENGATHTAKCGAYNYREGIATHVGLVEVFASRSEDPDAITVGAARIADTASDLADEVDRLLDEGDHTDCEERYQRLEREAAVLRLRVKSASESTQQAEILRLAGKVALLTNLRHEQAAGLADANAKLDAVRAERDLAQQARRHETKQRDAAAGMVTSQVRTIDKLRREITELRGSVGATEYDRNKWRERAERAEGLRAESLGKTVRLEEELRQRDLALSGSRVRAADAERACRASGMRVDELCQENARLLAQLSNATVDLDSTEGIKSLIGDVARKIVGSLDD